MVRVDNTTLCFHLGCCYSTDKAAGRETCRISTPATAAIAGVSTEWFSANQAAAAFPELGQLQGGPISQ